MPRGILKSKPASRFLILDADKYMGSPNMAASPESDLDRLKARRMKRRLEKIEEMADSALLDGVIEAECGQCGMLIQCEPDAATAWCDNCDKVVSVKNYLRTYGLI